MNYTSVSDLTVDELRKLIREVVSQTILEIFVDPDQGLELRDGIKKRLNSSLETIRKGGKTISAEQVAENLGLEW